MSHSSTLEERLTVVEQELAELKKPQETHGGTLGTAGGTLQTTPPMPDPDRTLDSKPSKNSRPTPEPELPGEAVPFRPVPKDRSNP